MPRNNSYPLDDDMECLPDDPNVCAACGYKHEGEVEWDFHETIVNGRYKRIYECRWCGQPRRTK